MKTTLREIRNYLLWLGLSGLFLAALLNYVWLIYYGFDKTPIMAIDSIIGLNYFIIFSFTRNIIIARIMLYGLNILLCLLGFILIHGLLFNI